MNDTDTDMAVARLAIAEFDFSEEVELRMINLSENATFLVEDAQDGRNGILRVHRQNYHSAASIGSELLWLDALRTDAGVSTPFVYPARDGRRVVTIDDRGTERHAVLFGLVGGIEPDELEIGASDFQTLGALTARLHQHAKSWQPPPEFQRFSWDWANTLGASPRWGRWQDGIGMGPEEVELIDKAVDLVRQRLEAFGTSPDRFGLVHADLRLANLLVDRDNVNVIDFDDCGFSWFLYDFGTAVSFLEDDPRLAEWQAAWLEGYRHVAELSAQDEEMIPTFVMLRRLMLVAWMGSHSHSREVQLKGPTYAKGTCDLARRYLSSSGHSL